MIKPCTIKEFLELIKERNIPEDTELFVSYYSDRPITDIGHCTSVSGYDPIKHKIIFIISKSKEVTND
jgi:hypothetical protein